MKKNEQQETIESILMFIFGTIVACFLLVKWLLRGIVELAVHLDPNEIQKRKQEKIEKALFALLETGVQDKSMAPQRMIKLLRALGYKEVHQLVRMFCHGSDIRARYEGELCIFRCQFQQARVGVETVHEIDNARLDFKAMHAIVVTNTTYTNAAKKAAREHNVQLWDKNTLCDKCTKIEEI